MPSKDSYFSLRKFIRKSQPEGTSVLAKHAVNVKKLTTRTESGPMSSNMPFGADAELTAPSALDARMLKTDLEVISNDLMVKIALGEIV
jgi:glycine cleavage system regulatory protein